MITSIPRNSNWPYPSTPPSACNACSRTGPVTAHAGSTHAIPRNATEFLDGCSGIDPDIDDNPNLAQTTLEHAPDASFYFFTVGRLKTIDDIKHMVLALPRSATGQPRAIKRYSDFTLATVGDLNDLPMIMGVLA